MNLSLGNNFLIKMAFILKTLDMKTSQRMTDKKNLDAPNHYR